jgi:hypothetical protein
MDPTDAPRRVKLGNREFALELPRSFTQRHEIVTAMKSSPQRACTAALGACCPRIERMLSAELGRVISYAAAQHNAAIYGALILDAFMQLNEQPKEGEKRVKIRLPEIMAAGAIAYDMLVDSLVDEDEVKAAEGNSEAPA